MKPHLTEVNLPKRGGKKPNLECNCLNTFYVVLQKPIYWASLEFPRPPREKLMWTERFEGGASPFVVLSFNYDSKREQN